MKILRDALLSLKCLPSTFTEHCRATTQEQEKGGEGKCGDAAQNVVKKNFVLGKKKIAQETL